MTDAEFLAALNEALAYDPETGEFTWKVFRGGNAKKGSIAGATDSKGHRQIRFNMRLYGAHRLAWIMSYGRWPNGEVDHINRNRSDNRLANLRECSHADNSKNNSLYANNTSGATGVFWVVKTGKFLAYITVNGRRKSLGQFVTFEEAYSARKAAEERHFGAFAAQQGVELTA